MSGHKVYGPKGIGALWVRRRRPTVRLAPILHGGGHERGLRSGTLNVPGVVGMGEALAIAAAEREAETARVSALRDRLWNALREGLPDIQLNGHPTLRLANNLNVSFMGVEAEDLLHEIPNVAVSTGAACSSASPEPSHVITALGLGQARAQSSIRFGLHRFTTSEEIDEVAADVVQAVRKLRELTART
jgi:cysteine desulfurase